MLKTSKTPTSIHISHEGNSFSIVINKAGELEYHQNLQGRDKNSGVELQNFLKNVLLNAKIGKIGKNDVNRRLGRIANIVTGFEKVNSFKILYNRLKVTNFDYSTKEEEKY